MNIKSHTKVDLYLTKDLKAGKKCELSLEGDGFTIKESKNGKIILNVSFLDFIGLGINCSNEKNFIVYTSAWYSVGCLFKSKARTDTRMLVDPKKLTYYHQMSDAEIKSLQDEIMENFQNHLKIQHGCGIENTYNINNDANSKNWMKKALVFINPHAGRGKSLQIFEESKPYLIANGFVLDDVIITTKKDEISETLQKMDKQKFLEFYQVILVGGDGTVHEAINGFYKNPNLQELNLRIGCLMGGGACASSVNQGLGWGLCCGENGFNSLWALTRARFQPMNIIRMATDGPQPVIYGFHSLSLAFVADKCELTEAARSSKISGKPYYFKLMELQKKLL